jgi:hypothetical protein
VRHERTRGQGKSPGNGAVVCLAGVGSAVLGFAVLGFAVLGFASLVACERASYFTHAISAHRRAIRYVAAIKALVVLGLAFALAAPILVSRVNELEGNCIVVTDACRCFGRDSQLRFSRSNDFLLLVASYFFGFPCPVNPTVQTLHSFTHRSDLTYLDSARNVSPVTGNQANVNTAASPATGASVSESILLSLLIVKDSPGQVSQTYRVPLPLPLSNLLSSQIGLSLQGATEYSARQKK